MYIHCFRVLSVAYKERCGVVEELGEEASSEMEGIMSRFFELVSVEHKSDLDILQEVLNRKWKQCIVDCGYF